jgi:hypothetical protein
MDPTKGGAVIELRRWSDHVWGVYLVDGTRFGRFVCVVDEREN